MLKEFKEFITRGNVVDLAVAVIMGAAFGKIVTSLVDNIITPLIGIIMGGININSLVWQVGNAKFAYGAFLQSIIDFIIIAFVIFLFVKALNKMSALKKTNEEEAPEETPSKTDLYLQEIRDLLKNQNSQQK